MKSYIDIKTLQELQFIKIFEIIRGFFLTWSRSSKNQTQNMVFHDCQKTLIPDVKLRKPPAIFWKLIAKHN